MPTIHRPLPRRHGLRHSGTPANEYPAHHEEDLAPAVDEDLLVGVGPAAILHSVVTSPPVPEDSLLAEDYERCTRKREEQRLPAPMATNVDCEGQEEQYKWQGILVLSFHVAGIQVLLDEDASIYALEHADD